MIVTILPSSSNFHAVGYNEDKVKKGTAYLMEMKNFGVLEYIGVKSQEDLINHLKKYSSSNFKIQKSQFHVAFSCKGNEMSHEELLDFAHRYLDKMGYGHPDQPLLVYAHSDTDNNHIHIITSRVDPTGRKIDNNNERIRSQKIIDELLNQNTDLKVKKDIEDAKKYNFRTVSQFRSILESMGYETFEKNNLINIKRGGRVLESIENEKIEEIASKNEEIFEEPNYNKLFGIFSKYRDLNTNIHGLKNDLKKKFGIDLVFFGRKDSPYGFAIVDHNNKYVIDGSKVMGIKRLFLFKSEEERFNKIDNYILDCLRDNSTITSKEINQKLKKINAYIRGNTIYFGKQKKQLNLDISDTLKRNDKLAWIDSFRPKSKEEFNLLAKIINLDTNSIKFPRIYMDHLYDPLKISKIENIISNSNNIGDVKETLKNEGYKLIYSGDKYFVYNSKERLLIDLERLKISIPQRTGLPNERATVNKPNSPIISTGAAVEHGVNREWEVGTKGNWDEVDNASSLKY